MRNLNSVFLIGNLTRTLGGNPQSKDLVYFQNGTAKAVLSIAVNDTKKDQNGNWTDEANFFNVTVWGKTVDNLKVYLVKGAKIAVQGKLHQNRWTDQQGQNHSSIEIIAENIELCGGHSAQQSPQPTMNQQQPTQQAQWQMPPQPAMNQQSQIQQAPVINQQQQNQNWTQMPTFEQQTQQIPF